MRLADLLRAPAPPAQDLVVARLKASIDSFREVLPVFEEVANPALRLRHWEALFALLGKELLLNELGQPLDFTLRELMYTYHVEDQLEQVGLRLAWLALVEQQLLRAGQRGRGGWRRCKETRMASTFSSLLLDSCAAAAHQVQVLSVAASKEAGLERTLDKMKADWSTMAFRIVDYKDTGALPGCPAAVHCAWLRLGGPG
jgi:dynein heavy chain